MVPSAALHGLRAGDPRGNEKLYREICHRIRDVGCLPDLCIKTGYPAETDILGVSVYGPKGHSADCDALATICLLYGEKKGSELIGSLEGYEAVFIGQDGTVSVTDGMVFTPSD